MYLSRKQWYSEATQLHTHTPIHIRHTHNQVITGKNEVTLEFHQNEATSVSLVEMRFHIPNAEGEGDAVAAFRDKALAHADIIQATGDAIVTFTEIQTLTPRYMVACNVSCYNVHVRSCSIYDSCTCSMQYDSCYIQGTCSMRTV